MEGRAELSAEPHPSTGGGPLGSFFVVRPLEVPLPRGIDRMFDQAIASFLGGFGRERDINAVGAVNQDLAFFGAYVTRPAEQFFLGHAGKTF